MFERYTQKARRIIFFARYECSVLKSPEIGTEHLLLGLLRESPETVQLYLNVDVNKLTTRLTSNAGSYKVSTSVDLPLDDASKRVLAHAAEEASRLAHQFIDIEDLLLGILHEERGVAAEALRSVGAPDLAEVRVAVSESKSKGVIGAGSNTTMGPEPPSMKLLLAESGRELIVRLPLQAVPRIGEVVVLTMLGEDCGSYRIVDVRWEFHDGLAGDSLHLKAVMLLVRREDVGFS